MSRAHHGVKEELGEGVDGVAEESGEGDVARERCALVLWQVFYAHVTQVLQSGAVVRCEVLAGLGVEGRDVVYCGGDDGLDLRAGDCG